jgi:hypothetical protein
MQIELRVYSATLSVQWHNNDNNNNNNELSSLLQRLKLSSSFEK